MTQPAFPPLPPPVAADPEILLLIGLTGAVLGAAASIAGYLATSWAAQRGMEQRILPEAPPFFRQQ